MNIPMTIENILISISRPCKIYPNWEFGFENIPSGSSGFNAYVGTCARKWDNKSKNVAKLGFAQKVSILRFAQKVSILRFAQKVSILRFDIIVAKLGLAKKMAKLGFTKK
jgi:hypothetical protein